MDNKGTDRRIQRTRALLMDALRSLVLEKGYEAITVQDLIDRANIGRSTFYAHFQDKETLLLSGAEMMWGDLEAHLRAQTNPGDSVWDLTLAMFQHAQEQSSLFSALARDQGSTLALKHMQKRLYAIIYDHMKAAVAHRQPEVPIEIIVHHLVSSFVALLTWWVEHDVSYSAEQINGYYRQMVQSGIGTMF